MAELKIRNAGQEPIYTAGLLDAAGNLLTGLANVYLRIRRDSDGWFLDFDDVTFKSSPGSITVQMTEVSAANLPGVYRYLFNLANVTNEAENDVYHFRVTCASAVNAPQEGVVITDDLEAKSGWGDYVFTVTAQDSDTDPIVGATVMVKDSTGDVIIGRNTTDANGQTTFLLDSGSYSIYVYASGYSFSNPYSQTVTGDGSRTITGTGDGTFEVTPPTAPSVCRVYGYFKDLGGNAVADVKVKAELSNRSAYVTGAATGTLLTRTYASTKSDANGYWQLDLIPNSLLSVEPSDVIGEPATEYDTVYRFMFEDSSGGFKMFYPRVTVPNESTKDFKLLV